MTNLVSALNELSDTELLQLRSEARAALQNLRTPGIPLHSPTLETFLQQFQRLIDLHELLFTASLVSARREIENAPFTPAPEQSEKLRGDVLGEVREFESQHYPRGTLIYI